MKPESIFSENDYDEAFEYASKNGYTIEETDPQNEYVEKEIEFINNKGETERKIEKELITVRYFKIVEIPPITNEDIRKKRYFLYSQKVDPLMSEYIRKKTFNLFAEGEDQDLLNEIASEVEKIKKENPYLEQ